MPDMKDYSSWTVAFEPMNIWECEHPGCPVKAVGMGGAAGLNAIGWYFQRGSKILCPLHRPDPVDRHSDTPGCRWWREGQTGKDTPKEKDLPCSLCKAEAEAMAWQKEIIAAQG